MQRTLALVFAIAALVQAVDVPAVPTITDPQAYVLAVVPDVKRTLANLDQALAACKLPVPAGLIATQLGAVLGDPGLTKLASGPILVAVGPGIPIPTWCAIVPLADPAALKPLADRSGLAVEAVPGGVAIGAMVGGTDLAKRLAPTLPALAKDIPASSDFRVMVASDRLIQAYLPLMIMGLQQGMAQSARMQGQKQGPEQQRMQQAMSAVMKTAFAQFGPACVDVSSSAQGWRVEVLAAPAPGVLADSIQPLTGTPADISVRLGASEQRPVMALTGRFPPTVYLGLSKLLAECRRDPVIAGMVDDALVKAVASFATAIDGRLAMRQGVAGNPFQQAMVMGVADAAALQSAMTACMGLCEKGAMADALAAAGMRMHIERSVRSVGAFAVDRIVQEIIPGVMPEAQAQMMAEMLKPTEMAVGKDIMVFGRPAAVIDAALAGPAGQPMQLAALAIPGQWDMRGDWDFPLQMRYQMEMMHAQMPETPPMFQDVKGGNPVRLAWAFGPARVRMAVEVPAAMVEEMVAAWSAMMAPRFPAAGRPAPALPAEAPTF